MEILLGLVVLVQFGFIFYLVSQTKNTSNDYAKQLNNDIKYLHRLIDENFKHNQNLEEMKNNRLDENLHRTNKSFLELSEKVSSFSEIAKNMQLIGRDIAGLHNLLSAPKLRGNLGEHLLIDLLNEHFPKSIIESQKKLSNGTIVDAVIKLKGDQFVCVDSKFPLENYKKMMEVGLTEEEVDRNRRVFLRDVKKHISDISQKYIVPNDGSLDFAIMYVPAESIYFEITKHMDAGMLRYALDSKVIICSPTNLFAYLQTIVMGLKGFEIEEKAKEVFKFIMTLKKDITNLRSEFGVLGGHIASGAKKINSVENMFDQIDLKIDKFEQINE